MPSQVVFTPLEDCVAQEPDLFVPEIRRQSRLVLEMREEVRWFLEVLPDLGQEGAGVVAVLEYHPVDAGTQLPEGVRLVAEAQRLERREHRDLERHTGALPGSERRKTRIAEGGGRRVCLHL